MKKNRFKIAITQRIDFSEKRQEKSDSLDLKLTNLVFSLGYMPIIIPNILDKKSHFLEWYDVFKPDGFILSGGNDLKQYPIRDKIEMHILKLASENAIPLLGICRGMEIMAVWAGAPLIKIKNHVGTKHNFKKKHFPKKVNSFHDFAIVNCPKNFKIMIQEKDSVIEAIQHKTLPWEGWMWHPERDETYQKENLTRIKNLFKERAK